MTLYEQSKVRENITLSTTDTTYDTLITDKGTEADNWVVRKFKEIYEKSNRLAELPIFSITDGTVNGSTAPQDIKDLATNRTTYLCAIAQKQWDAVKEYKEIITEQLQAIMDGLQVDEDIYLQCATI